MQVAELKKLAQHWFNVAGGLAGPHGMTKPSNDSKERLVLLINFGYAYGVAIIPDAHFADPPGETG